ncbi:hypothetical protein DL771_007965 [Monosporascus sp. 5C6A]|nr:hypothetical protein DL771_007965 [Monosporascus sp. 5C6A]
MANVSQPRETYEAACLKNLVNKDSLNRGRYQHKRLNKDRKEIRLIKILNRFTFEDFLFTPEGLQRSEEDADFRLSNEQTFVIKVVIEEHPLESAPPYVALSYTWGDASVKRRPVFVPLDLFDPQCEKFYLIEATENLFQALRQLPPLQDISHIWADAICINQTDEVEKTWQVQQMWDIYKSSRFVMMWMGSGGASTNKFMDMMRDTMAEETKRLIAGGGDDIGPDQLRVPDAFSMMSEFQRLAQNGYWTRAWIRQEISSHEPDKVIVCYGRRLVEFNVLDYFVKAIINSAQDIDNVSAIQRTPHQETIWLIARSPAFRIMSDALDSSLKGEKARIVHILYNWVRRFYVWGDGLQANDPRDLIYSLLGMTNWRPQDGDRMKPDYTIDARKVYIKMTKQWPRICVWRNDSDDNSANDLNLPSWVPDWRRPIRPVHLLKLPPWQGNSEGNYWTGNMLAYKGGYEIKPTSYSDSEEGPCYVHMEGFVLDIIDEVGPTMTPDPRMTSRETCREWVAVLNVLRRTGDASVQSLSRGLSSLSISTAQSKHAAVSQLSRWQLPIINVGVVDGWLKKAPEIYQRAFDFFSHQTPHAEAVEDELEATISRYADITLAACSRKRFILSKHGLLGLAFRSVRPGDSIVVFPGIDVPLILRKVEGKGYQIISDAYVQGIMDGETKESVGPGGFRLEDFAIF